MSEVEESERVEHTEDSLESNMDAETEAVQVENETGIDSKTCVSASSKLMKITIKDWVQIGTWKWIANDETCGVCRMTFEAACAKCKYPGDDCPVVAGQCRHSFHMHCIMDWLQSQQVQQQCPLCRQEWRFPNMTTT